MIPHYLTNSKRNEELKLKNDYPFTQSMKKKRTHIDKEDLMETYGIITETQEKSSCWVASEISD